MTDSIFRFSGHRAIDYTIIPNNLWDSISGDDRNIIINQLKNETNSSKLRQLKDVLLFYSTMHSINPDYVKKHSIISEINRVKNGLFTPKVVTERKSIRTFQTKWCKETYGGFLRALKRDTLQIVNVSVDGNKKTMLLKSNPGESVLFNFTSGKSKDFSYLTLKGYNTLLMDPKTFDIYGINISKFGTNILYTSKSLKVSTDYIRFSSLSLDNKNYDLILRELKKEMPNYLREKRKAYLAHYEQKLVENPKKQAQVKKRINKIFSDKKINSFSRSIGKNKSFVK